MSAIKILPDIYWVGAIDWSMRNFHGATFNTRTGTTYNAYLILDDKVTLVDTVHGAFAQELIQKISQIIRPEKIDYIIANHVEIDHSGALPEILKLCPKAKLFGTAACKEGITKYYHPTTEFQVVKTGNTLNLGKRTLTFIEAPMIHWPDSMFTYCQEDELLLPNDAFGQHYATSERFDDEVNEAVLMDELAKYYANILWPLSGVILKKIEDIQKMNIVPKMIAPSHGIIWRKNPQKAIAAYLSWAKNETQPKVVMVYETMWGATEKMAKVIAEGVMEAGVEVETFDITRSDRTEIINRMLDVKGFIIGSSTHYNEILPTIAGFLEFLKTMKPKNRVACVFGSFGWGGGAVKRIEDLLRGVGIEIVSEGLAVKYIPDAQDSQRCFEFGKDFARKVKGQ